MLKLYFEDLQRPERHALGPASAFHLEGPYLKTEEGEEIAVHRDNRWEMGDKVFIALVADTPVQITVEKPIAPSKTFGPFEAVRIVDGAIRAGEKQGLVAKLHEERAWHVRQTDDLHQVLILSAAEP